MPGGDRTEQATPRRRQKAREQGDRVRSRDLLGACAMVAGTLSLRFIAPMMVSRWKIAYEQFLLLGAAGWDQSASIEHVLGLRTVLIATMWPIGLVFAASGLAALAAGIGQGGGFGLYFPALKPSWSRANPLRNFRNLFSLRATGRLAKSLVPAALLVWLAAKKLAHQAAMPPLSAAHLPEMFLDGYDLLTYAAGILFLWSAVDYAIEWRSREQRLRMNKQEVREEFKEQEGSPQIKRRIRGLQRQMRARKLKADVARASVVITNPTHYAVALSFDFDTMEAPKVLAKGRNLLAEKIKAEARWAGVPITENPPLARSLFRSVEPGDSIPFELYAAVAGILAYLYRKEVEERARKRQEPKQAQASTPAVKERKQDYRERVEENR